MVNLFANSGNPDQMPHSAASNQGLHCLPSTLLQVSRLQWVNAIYIFITVGTRRVKRYIFANCIQVNSRRI